MTRDGSKLAFGTIDLYVFNISQSERSCVVPKSKFIQCQRFSPDARVLAAGKIDGQITLLKQESDNKYTVAHTFNDHGFGVREIDFAETKMISASDDLINLTDLESSK